MDDNNESLVEDIDDDLIKDMVSEDDGKKEDTASILDLAKEAVDLRLAIDTIEADAKIKKKRLTALLEQDIPLKMNEIGSIGLDLMVGNHTVNLGLQYKVRGSINYAPDLEEAVAYLVKAGFDGSILTKASVDFTEGELDDKKVAALKKMFSTKFDKDIHLDRNINAQTLMAFVRTKLDDTDFDPKVVGATVMREAKLTIK